MPQRRVSLYCPQSQRYSHDLNHALELRSFYYNLGKSCFAFDQFGSRLGTSCEKAKDAD
jgi:hypothetical protein